MLGQGSPCVESDAGRGTGAADQMAVQIKLTRKETQLLELLQKNAGRCLPRAYLLEAIWGYRNGTKTRTLDVHIQRLRRKLGPELAKHIVTVLRGGYAWQETPGMSRVDYH